MENRGLNTKTLRLARVKYYDTKHDGAEVNDIDAYAFLEKVGDEYVNLFDPTDGLAVFERSIYPNVTRDGEEYGNKIIHVCGNITDGACYVMDRVSVPELFGKDEVSLSELKSYILNSKLFFVDRISIIKGQKRAYRLLFYPTLLADQKQMAEFQQFIASHEGAKQYVK